MLRNTHQDIIRGMRNKTFKSIDFGRSQKSAGQIHKILQIFTEVKKN